MQIPNFHDGTFDGIWIGPDNLVQLFLRKADRQSFVLSLVVLERLAFTDIQQGNIILDLVLRSAAEITRVDIAELYGVGADSLECVTMMTAATERRLQILERNPSYGAQGLALFQTLDIAQREVQP